MPSLAKVKEAFGKYFRYSDSNIVDVVMGTVIANQLPCDPVSLYIIGLPASGKTEVLHGSTRYVPQKY